VVCRNCHCITRQGNSYGSFRGIWFLSMVSRYTMLKLKEISEIILRNCHSASFREWVEYHDRNHMFLYMVTEIDKVHITAGHEGTTGEYRYKSTLSLTSVVDGGGQRYTPAALPPGKRPGNHCTGSWWAPGPAWTAEEILAPPGFDPWTVQPAASRYTD
jgi:hypothetical protein